MLDAYKDIESASDIPVFSGDHWAASIALKIQELKNKEKELAKKKGGGHNGKGSKAASGSGVHADIVDVETASTIEIITLIFFDARLRMSTSAASVALFSRILMSFSVLRYEASWVLASAPQWHGSMLLLFVKASPISPTFCVQSVFGRPRQRD